MFRNRGELPNINLNGNDNNTTTHRNMHMHMIFIVKYDKNFVLIQMVLLMIIALFALAVYLVAYKPNIQDPLADIKQTFLTAQIVAIGITIALSGIVTFLSKNRDILMRNLMFITVISSIMLVFFLGTKIYIDKNHTEETFGNFYEEYENKPEKSEQNKERNKNSKKDKITIGLSGIKMSTEKEAYIESSKSAYANFTTKAVLLMLVHSAVIILLFYLNRRVKRIDVGNDILEKDDNILFDEDMRFK